LQAPFIVVEYEDIFRKLKSINFQGIEALRIAEDIGRTYRNPLVSNLEITLHNGDIKHVNCCLQIKLSYIATPRVQTDVFGVVDWRQPGPGRDCIAVGFFR
jgi:hypothetical protein